MLGFFCLAGPNLLLCYHKALKRSSTERGDPKRKKKEQPKKCLSRFGLEFLSTVRPQLHSWAPLSGLRSESITAAFSVSPGCAWHRVFFSPVLVSVVVDSVSSVAVA